MNYMIGERTEVSKTISERDEYLFAGICGDFNLIHVKKIEVENCVLCPDVVFM